MSSKSTAPDLPGFYYDAEKNRYFKIGAPGSMQSTVPIVKKQKVEPKTKLSQTNLVNYLIDLELNAFTNQKEIRIDSKNESLQNSFYKYRLNNMNRCKFSTNLIDINVDGRPSSFCQISLPNDKKETINLLINGEESSVGNAYDFFKLDTNKGSLDYLYVRSLNIERTGPNLTMAEAVVKKNQFVLTTRASSNRDYLLKIDFLFSDINSKDEIICKKYLPQTQFEHINRTPGGLNFFTLAKSSFRSPVECSALSVAKLYASSDDTINFAVGCENCALYCSESGQQKSPRRKLDTVRSLAKCIEFKPQKVRNPLYFLEI